MVTLWCVLVGVKGSAFPVNIETTKSVGELKDAIKGKNENDLKGVDAKNLQLFLAKKGDAWLDSSSDDVKKLKKGEKTATIEELTLKDKVLDEQDDITDLLVGIAPPAKKEIHVLVVIPADSQGAKRVRAEEWFPEERKTKRRSTGNGNDQPAGSGITTYFEMNGFPPMAHGITDYTKILERDSYGVLFEELMSKTKTMLGKNADANLVVTGNPGTGKSRFYLYCVFRLIRDTTSSVVAGLPRFQLVLNFDNKYHKFLSETSEFCEQDQDKISTLQEARDVVRLVEGRSSILTGWKGISILFSSPGLPGINDFAKVHSTEYILPIWSCEELMEYNMLLDDSLKLPMDLLMERFNKYGGIPRFIFENTEVFNTEKLDQAISSFDALKVIEMVKKKGSVRERNYSHLVLQMVPDSSNFEASFHLDFLSNYIAEQIVAKIADDSLEAVSQFAIANQNDDSGNTAALRGRIYEFMCHRCFKLSQPIELRFRSLSSTRELVLNIPADLSIVRFRKLDEITFAANCWTYYQPISKRFGALDAFVVDSTNSKWKCYGLQMTINSDHGIKVQPMSEFLEWLNGRCDFFYGFLVPSEIARDYQVQTMRTKNNTVHQRPGSLSRVHQFVAALDPFVTALV